MAKELKKASLLTEAEKQKLRKKSATKKLVAQHTEPTAARSGYVGSLSTPRYRQAAEPVATNKTVSRYWFILLLLFLLAVVFSPKPQLVQYHTAGMTTTSIYMPGWFGQPGSILDTKQRALLSVEEQSLYLCFPDQQTEQCTKYQIKELKGPFAALWYLLRHE